MIVSADTVTVQSDFEQSLIEKAIVSVHQFDQELSSMSLVAWISSVAKDSSTVIWEVNDCGEQSGSPADYGEDFPACVTVVVSVSSGQQAQSQPIYR
ncbi:hypothetical protein KAJ27_21265 [bacterium]|nr:hypothetical protein [bacterium]